MLASTEQALGRLPCQGPRGSGKKGPDFDAAVEELQEEGAWSAFGRILQEEEAKKAAPEELGAWSRAVPRAVFFARLCAALRGLRGE